MLFAFAVRVQQNGAFFGLYHFVEKGDNNFLERAGLDPEGSLYKVVTSEGELFFNIESDRKTGVVDMFAGPALDQMGIFPCRVIAMPGGPTAVSFTFFQPPNMPDEVYERQYKSLLIEMDGLKQRFGAK